MSSGSGVCAVGPQAASVEQLAGSLRTEVNRLAYHLRVPATKSGITPTRLAALSALAHNPQGCRHGDLAAKMGVSPASMTRLVDVMVEAGWVAKLRDPSDARACLLQLSPEGHRTIEALRSESTGALCADLGELSVEDRAALAAAVPILRRIADRRLGDQA